MIGPKVVEEATIQPLLGSKAREEARAEPSTETALDILAMNALNQEGGYRIQCAKPRSTIVLSLTPDLVTSLPDSSPGDDVIRNDLCSVGGLGYESEKEEVTLFKGEGGGKDCGGTDLDGAKKKRTGTGIKNYDTKISIGVDNQNAVK